MLESINKRWVAKSKSARSTPLIINNEIFLGTRNGVYKYDRKK